MRLLTLHDILTAWHNGEIPIENALVRARIGTEFELREAAMNSGVLPMRPLTMEEREHQKMVDVILASVGEHP